MPKDSPDAQALIAAWRTSHRVTSYLIENLPPELWSQNVPGVPRRTVRMIAAHIHNARCMWIKMLGGRHGIAVPARVDGRRVRPSELSRALERSSAGIMESEMRKQTEASTPLGRIGKPRDIAGAAVFLASDDAAWLTGETLFISGGLR